MNLHKLKAKVAKHVITLLPDSGIIALGSGSTVNEVIREIADRDMNFQFISASSATSILLQEFNLEEIKLGYAMKKSVDLCIDGADLIFPNDTKLIIKGHGGALLREKLIWSVSSKIYVVVDNSKISEEITKPIPVEIIPRSFPILKTKISNLKNIIDVDLKMSGGIPFITDNNNYIFHVTVNPVTDIRKLHDTLKKLTGVIETGIFAENLTNNSEILISSNKGIQHLS